MAESQEPKERNMNSRRIGAGVGLLLWAAALPTVGHAAVSEDNFQMHSAGDLLTLCSADSADPMMTAAANFCHGFTLGVYQTLEEEQNAMRSKLFCVTDPRPSRNAAITAFIAWLKPQPTVQATAPADAILKYLEVTYPCKKPH
jgi:hypothetical protein